MATSKTKDKDLKADVSGMIEAPLAPRGGSAIARKRAYLADPELISLVDRKYALTQLKRKLEEELADVDAELKEEMIEGEVIYGSEGIGYRLSIARQDVYEDDIIPDLEELDLLPYFAKVSTQKLHDLVKEGVLSWSEFFALKAKSSTREIPALREVVSAEAKVF